MSATRTMDWTEEGRRIGVTLDAFHAVIVVGIDPVATAETALGIARVQAVHRRVAVGDLLGEAPPLQALVSGDDPHGLVDSFLFGVSLSASRSRCPTRASCSSCRPAPARWTTTSCSRTRDGAG